MIHISVIICTYNRAGSLTKALASIEQLVIPANMEWELLVVDNNSSDSTRDVVEHYRQRDKLPIHYLFEPRQGKVHAANHGISKSRGSIVAFTDDDVLFDPQWLKALLDAFDRYDCAGVGGRVIALWDFPKPKWLGTPGMGKLINGGPIVSHSLGSNVPQAYERSGVPIPAGANMAFRRDVFGCWGRFRDDLGPIGRSGLKGEDNEFCQRLLDHGEMLIYCPDAVIYHPVESHRVTKKYLRRWMLSSGRSMARMEAVTHNSRLFLGIPLWQYKELSQIAIWYLVRKVSFNPKRHATELRLISLLGRIYEELKQFSIDFRVKGN